MPLRRSNLEIPQSVECPTRRPRTPLRTLRLDYHSILPPAARVVPFEDVLRTVPAQRHDPGAGPPYLPTETSALSFQ